MDDIVNLYVDGLPWCRASYEPNIHTKARKDGVKLSCSLYRAQAGQAVSWLKKRGYNAYIRDGEHREDLCEPMMSYDDEGFCCYDEPYDLKERWFPSDAQKLSSWLQHRKLGIGDNNDF